MVNVQIIGPVRCIPQNGEVGAVPLVCPVDGLQVPVGPEDEVVKDGDGEHVRYFERILDDETSVLAVQIRKGDVIQVSIRPKQFVGEVVDGQSVGPGQTILVGDDAAEVGSVHAHPADVGLQVPGGEVKVSDARMDHNSARI